MNSIGTIKAKILSKLTESYASGNKKEMKNIISFIQKNKSVRDLYLFYEEIEKKAFETENDAKLYVEEVIPLLIDQYVNAVPSICRINEMLGEMEVEKNPLYEDLDMLLSRRTIHNVDKKIIAKKNLIEHLVAQGHRPASTKESNIPLAENEKLFMTVLTNDFNVLYENRLSEEEKVELKNIMNMPSEEVKNKVLQLKEDVLSKVSSLLVEAVDDEMKLKLNTVKNQVGVMDPTKYNLYKLQELKNGLI